MIKDPTGGRVETREEIEEVLVHIFQDIMTELVLDMSRNIEQFT